MIRVFGLLLSLCLFTHPLMAQPLQWLARVDATLEAQLEGYEQLYRFRNGDLLYQFDSKSLQNAKLNQLMRTELVRYLEPEFDKLPNPRPDVRAAVEEVPQDFIQQDGFSGLNDTQRQCDQNLITVLDSGIDTLHSGLSHVAFSSPFNAINREEVAIDEYGHGTHVAGMLAAASEEVHGACSSASLMPVRFLGSSGGGSTSDAIRGITWALAHGAQIINHSWVVVNEHQALFDVMEDANSRGVLQIAAAGNSGVDNDKYGAYPAKYASKLTGVIAVANWDQEKQSLFQTSNSGYVSVDLAASGTQILSLKPNNQTGMQSGTSMATPLVTAAGAMLMQQHPDWSPAQIRAQLLATVNQEPSLKYKVRSGGRLNARASQEVEPTATWLLLASTTQSEVVLKGIGFDSGDEWHFQTIQQPAQHYELTPVSQSETEVHFVARELPWGYFQLVRHGEIQASLPYKPKLKSPSELALQRIEGGVVVSWRGDGIAQGYRIRAAIGNDGFQTLAEITAPTNQYFHAYSGDKSVRYKVQSFYSYSPFESAELKSIESDYSQTVQLSDSTLEWQTQTLASIPVGANAIIPILYRSEPPGQLSLQQDDSMLVETLYSPNKFQIDTDQISTGEVVIRHSFSAGSAGEETSSRSFQVQVLEQPYWQLALNQSESIKAAATGFDIHSFQSLWSGELLITGEKQTPNAILSLTLDAGGKGWADVEVRTVDGELVSPNQIQVSSRGIQIFLDESDSSSLDIKVSYDTQAIAASEDSRCFIASSVFAQEPDKLNSLREFRDKILLQIPGGKKLVSYYYQQSPVWVERVKQNKQAQHSIRWLLNGLLLVLEYWYLLLLVGMVLLFRPRLGF